MSLAHIHRKTDSVSVSSLSYPIPTCMRLHEKQRNSLEIGYLHVSCYSLPTFNCKLFLRLRHRRITATEGVIYFLFIAISYYIVLVFLSTFCSNIEQTWCTFSLNVHRKCYCACFLERNTQKHCAATTMEHPKTVSLSKFLDTLVTRNMISTETIKNILKQICNKWLCVRCQKPT